MKSLMGEQTSPAKSPEREVQPDGEAAGEAAVDQVRVESFEFASRVLPKKLRCLNI